MSNCISKAGILNTLASAEYVMKKYVEKVELVTLLQIFATKNRETFVS